MSPRAPFDHTMARRYTLEDGLGGLLVEDIHQDRRGLLWIATADGGVSRFDGEAFETWRVTEGLPHLTVMSIAEDAEGRLWFGTLGGGLAAFDGGGFRVYTTEHGLPSNEILGLRPQADGSMRLLTGEGIARFEDERCVECTTQIGGRPIGRVHDMVTDTTGTTWLATRERGILSLEGRSMSPVFAPGGEHHWAWNLAEDASGHLWIACLHRRKRAVVPRYDPRGPAPGHGRGEGSLRGRGDRASRNPADTACPRGSGGPPVDVLPRRAGSTTDGTGTASRPPFPMSL